MMEHLIAEKVGDRGGQENYSIKPFAFTINANPMSDRNQFIIEFSFYAQRQDNRDRQYSPNWELE